MQKNYFFTYLLILTGFILSAQVTLVDQPVAATNGIISSVLADSGFGTYSADDFTLTDNFSIDVITVNGFGSNESDISLNFTGLDLFIYDDATGVPDSDPSTSGSGLLEIINLSPTSPALVYDATDDSFTIDITMANGGAEFELNSGTYWLVVAARAPSDAVRWNWFASDPGGNAMLFDEGNFGGVPWTDLITLGLTFDSLAMKIEGTLVPLSVDEYVLETISIFPNPAKNTLNLEMPTSIGDFETEVFSVLGQSVARNSNSSQLDISNLNTGIYLLKITTENGTITKRFTKN
ncbi:T9SS type A sorting domain-containing protein [Psychroserpens luteus]|uniref:T9SS type A sorting domain-containing protein n=1 Tax=Psychroserpens luteus TaxID=1434066 RepID=A0ABW5ZWL9_9FLAO|nr:T9SS type A sorting domain-containing protein [Psychroserpens luteus]